MPAVDTLINQITAEMARSSKRTMDGHIRAITERVIHFVNRVYASSDPTEDTEEVKKEMVVAVLTAIANAISDGTMSLTYVKDENGKYTGEVTFETNEEIVSRIVPDAMLERSLRNRTKKLAKKLSA